MAPTVNEENEPHEASRDRQSDMESRRNTWLALGRLLLHMLCLGYNLYLVWLLAYLKGNSNYWFLSFIPFVFNFSPLLVFLISLSKPTSTVHVFLPEPSIGVVFNLMACFTMLTRVAYYHRQEDEFIGPRFIIISLQASIILVFLDFLQQRDAKLENLLNFKDAMIRILLDFVDIFNMVEILSRNPCVGVGLYVSENSSTERAIQAFCTLSFVVIMVGVDIKMLVKRRRVRPPEEPRDEPPRNEDDGEAMHSSLTLISSLYQNLPFLVIRIIVWAQYKLYSLGFLVKNVTVVILAIAIYYKA